MSLLTGLVFSLLFAKTEASGTATLTFIFPSAQEMQTEQVTEATAPAISLQDVRKEGNSLVIVLASSNPLEFKVIAFYNQGGVTENIYVFNNTVKEVRVPLFIGQPRKKLNSVQILWTDQGKEDQLIICNTN